MDDRKRAYFSCFVIGATFAATSCGLPGQSHFQNYFLPPSPPKLASASLLSENPAPALAPPNPYLNDLPAELLTPTPANPTRTAGDATMDRAQQRYEAGRKFYLSNDIAAARREFDAAVDLMILASSEAPGNRADYDRKFEALIDNIHRLDVAGMGSASNPADEKFEKAPLEDILTMTFPVDPKLNDKIREQVKASVSQLPLSVTDPVLSYINYFATRGHGTLVAGYQHSGRYRAMIERILDEEGVPRELLHLAQAESGFIPRAMSRMAAGGMWQFLTWRGQQYGLQQTRYTDDRMDPEMATRAAARHLHDLYNEFGDWYLAIAAYNCGPLNVERAVERTGYADFWELRSRGALPAETTAYVPIILALTIMEKNGAAYGLQGLAMDAPIEYDNVKMTALTNLDLAADITGVSAAEIAALNPAALHNLAPEGYILHVPKGMGNQTTAALARVPEDKRASWRMHRVETGETVAAIAKRYSVQPASLLAVNKLSEPTAETGDWLLIPAAARPEPVTRRIQSRASASSSARKKHSSTHPAAKAPVKTASTKTAPVKSKPTAIVASARQ
jgi:membrane-bound lytic murein transglycosylase D